MWSDPPQGNKHIVWQSWNNSLSSWMTLGCSHSARSHCLVETILKTNLVGPFLQTCFLFIKIPIDCLIKSCTAFIRQNLSSNCSLCLTEIWCVSQYHFWRSLNWSPWKMSLTKNVVSMFFPQSELWWILRRGCCGNCLSILQSLNEMHHSISLRQDSVWSEQLSRECLLASGGSRTPRSWTE